MADPRFFTRAGPFTLAELAKVTGAGIAPGAPADLDLVDVMPLDKAGEGDLTFIDNRKYLDAFRATKASAILAAPDLADQAPTEAALLLCDDPYRAYAKAAAAFYPRPAVEPGISPGAYVSPNATIGAGCRIEPGAVVQDGAEIGANCLIGPAAVIDRGVTMGSDCEIGANTTIDRATLGVTKIGAGTKLDNLVQVGHAADVGEGALMVAYSGVAGSTRLGPGVVLAAKAAVLGHLEIGAGTQVGVSSAVTQNQAPGSKVTGVPAIPHGRWLRASHEFAALPDLEKRVRELEKRLEEIEDSHD